MGTILAVVLLALKGLSLVEMGWHIAIAISAAFVCLDIVNSGLSRQLGTATVKIESLEESVANLESQLADVEATIENLSDRRGG